MLGVGEFSFGRHGGKRWFVAIGDISLDLGYRKGGERRVVWSIPFDAVAGYQHGRLSGQLVSHRAGDDRVLERFPEIVRLGPMRLASATVLFRLPLDPPRELIDLVARPEVPIDGLTIGSPDFDSIRVLLARRGIEEFDGFDHLAQNFGCRREAIVPRLNGSLVGKLVPLQRSGWLFGLVAYLLSYAFGVVIVIVAAVIAGAIARATERLLYRRAGVEWRSEPATRIQRRRRTAVVAIGAAIVAGQISVTWWDRRDLVDVGELRPGDCVGTSGLRAREPRRIDCDANGVVEIIAVGATGVTIDAEWKASCRRAIEQRSRDAYPDSDVEFGSPLLPQRVDVATDRWISQFDAVVDGWRVCGAMFWSLATD